MGVVWQVSKSGSGFAGPGLDASPNRIPLLGFRLFSSAHALVRRVNGWISILVDWCGGFGGSASSVGIVFVVMVVVAGVALAVVAGLLTELLLSVRLLVLNMCALRLPLLNGRVLLLLNVLSFRSKSLQVFWSAKIS